MVDALRIIKVEEDCDNCLLSEDGVVVFSSGALDCKVETDSTGWSSSYASSNGTLSTTEAKVFKEENCESLLFPMPIKCDIEETTLKSEDYLEESGDGALKIGGADPLCTEQTSSSAGIKAEQQQVRDGSAMAPVLSSEMNHPHPDLVSRYQLKRLSVRLVDCCTRLRQEGTNGMKNKDEEPEPVLCGGPETEPTTSVIPQSTAVPVITTHALTEKHCRSLCGEHFNARTSLTAHQLIHSGERPHVCQQCGKRLSSAAKLKVHNRIHTGERPYACQHCDKRFSRAEDLKRHQLIHTGEKSYVCHQCSKRFTRAEHLRQHQHVHTGERPYACHQCNKCFSQAGNLKVHQRIHTGEKPYVCHQCNKCFSQAGNLKVHQRIHTGERPYVCQHCGQSFSDIFRLKVHNRIHTGMASQTTQPHSNGREALGPVVIFLATALTRTHSIHFQ
ncbi:zinc finger protein ZFP2-like [Engraulis encrasicolus]|uniref:zinc finger protein ZFP2-like n=1 Tax=Engraulis encrasicolus TaxID=184585 RepID=UPI002FCE7588